MTAFKKYFFLGIGGIGMSALARYFKSQGALVAGYDKTQSPLTDQLVKEGIDVTFSELIDTIPAPYTEVDEGLLVVRTPAVPLDSPLIQFYRSQKAQMMKRSEVLALVASEKRCIAIAGTHGKTTTTSILGHILNASSLGCTAFVGGVMTGYESNILLDSSSDLVVLEADEFDRSFHKLRPEAAIITSVDADHLDIYGDESSFKQAFVSFSDQVGGAIIHEEHVDLDFTSKDSYSYGIEEGSIQATNVRVEEGRFVFDLSLPDIELIGLSISLPGRHNILNTIAAIAMCHHLGVSENEIRHGLNSYQGVKRRFQYQIEHDNLIFIDDYAHHPSEIHACIEAVRELYPQKKLTVVFQPHLYSRTRDFMDGFARALSKADEVILTAIYPAREMPIEGVDSEVLFDKLTITNKVLCVKEELPSHIAGRELEVLLTLGAGDIDREIPRVKDRLLEQLRPELS